MKTEHGRGATLGLRDDELAFYDAVCQTIRSDGACDEVLKRIAQELVDVVRGNATVDWTRRNSEASLRRHIRRLLTKYQYLRTSRSGCSTCHATGELLALESRRDGARTEPASDVLKLVESQEDLWIRLVRSRRRRVYEAVMEITSASPTGLGRATLEI